MSGRSRERRIDVGALQVGARYRVDWEHVELRRSFRLVGTLLSIEPEPDTVEGSEAARVLRFEIKPRFGKPAVATLRQSTLTQIRPA